VRCAPLKKLLCVIMALALAAALCACSAAHEPSGGDGRLRITATVFPIYDWTRNVIGDDGRAELSLLLDGSTDLHSYQASARDILEISSCDVLIYVGGESDEWIEDALGLADNDGMVVLKLIDLLGDRVKEEESVEGMKSSAGIFGRTDEEEPEADEHIWLSLRNAEVLVDAISGALQELVPESADTYRTNAQAYIEKLRALDGEYSQAVENASCRTLIFGDRFPFRYLVDDYGLSYYAAFAGCSAETEASFETIVFLADKADELSVPAVLAIDGGDGRVAATVAGNARSASPRVLTLDSMQSVSAKDIRNGFTYLSVMESDLAVLKEALGAGE